MSFVYLKNVTLTVLCFYKEEEYRECLYKEGEHIRNNSSCGLCGWID